MNNVPSHICMTCRVLVWLKDRTKATRGNGHVKLYYVLFLAELAGAHYIYCHSTGGLITLLALETLASKWDKLQGVIFSAPLIRRSQKESQKQKGVIFESKKQKQVYWD